MANYYCNYEVMWARISILFKANFNGVYNGTTYCGIKLDSNASCTLEPYTVARQDPTYRWGQFDNGPLDYTKGGQCIVTHYWSRKKIPKENYDLNKVAAGSNPTSLPWAFVPVVSMSKSVETKTPAITMQVRIKFGVKWTERKDFDNSVTLPLME